MFFALRRSASFPCGGALASDDVTPRLDLRSWGRVRVAAGLRRPRCGPSPDVSPYGRLRLRDHGRRSRVVGERRCRAPGGACERSPAGTPGLARLRKERDSYLAQVRARITSPALRKEFERRLAFAVDAAPIDEDHNFRRDNRVGATAASCGSRPVTSAPGRGGSASRKPPAQRAGVVVGYQRGFQVAAGDCVDVTSETSQPSNRRPLDWVSSIRPTAGSSLAD